MNRRMKGVLLTGVLAVAMAFATVVLLKAALARVLDPYNYCETGFSSLSGCSYHWSSTSTGLSSPIFTTPSRPESSAPSDARDKFKPISVNVTSWAVADCPSSTIAERLLCTPVTTLLQAASDDLATGLPRPKPWVVTTGKDSPFIRAVHVETPLDLASTLGFYRDELSKRGWTEHIGGVVEADGATIAFTTLEGPALLRLTRQDGRTIADLSVRKPAAANAAIMPKQGEARLLLGNTRDEEAVITINERVIKLTAHAGRDVTNDPESAGTSPDRSDINLPPGKYKVSLKIANAAAERREFEVAAGETWGLLVGPAGVPLPVRIY